MAIDLITREDLQKFKNDLLDELRAIIMHDQTPDIKKWLKTKEVRKLLQMSAGKLHSLRVSGALKFTRIGGLLYYDKSDIERLFNKNKKP
ncbi:helix-turn-helix domain-containing protein [Mucilaginibacter defluvii]|uniref:Helix-turn-helix domain-containing protein n=1 Tax=Mucilaginibacter defluvii TaxID=1196019 RepID=A0ABP9FLH5_9SPHI